jgi:hypothetical protein
MRRDVKTIRHEVKTLRRKVKMMRLKVKTLRLKVKTMRRNVKTMRLNVKTMRRDVKTLRRNVKTLRRHNASNLTVFEAFSKCYILTDHIFIIKKNMSIVSRESIILAMNEVIVNLENWKSAKF